MLQLLAGTDAGKGLVRFERHRPEQTLLYKLVEQYYPDFEMQWASEGRAGSGLQRNSVYYPHLVVQGKSYDTGRVE
jgi:hypothetical protein